MRFWNNPQLKLRVYSRAEVAVKSTRTSFWSNGFSVANWQDFGNQGDRCKTRGGASCVAVARSEALLLEDLPRLRSWHSRPCSFPCHYRQEILLQALGCNPRECYECGSLLSFVRSPDDRRFALWSNESNENDELGFTPI